MNVSWIVAGTDTPAYTDMSMQCRHARLMMDAAKRVCIVELALCVYLSPAPERAYRDVSLVGC